MIAYQLELNQAQIKEHLREAQNLRKARQVRALQINTRASLRYQVGRRLVRYGFALAGYKLDQKEKARC